MHCTRDVFRIMTLGIGLPALVGTLGCMSIVDRFSGGKESCEIVAAGKPATGKIVRLIDTGTTINNDPVVEFLLYITAPGVEPYEARTKHLVSRLDIPSIQPGRIVPVRYDQQTPARVAIDLWECPKQ
jgi:hypothetical protein